MNMSLLLCCFLNKYDFFLFQGHFLQWFSYVFVFHYFLLIQVSKNKNK